MHYRPEIDGLRALAVLPVIFFHAGFAAFNGGYVGVDVFFVISGYLITSIIEGRLQEGRFSLLEFYERRVRRILPGLFIVCMLCIPFALLWMMPIRLANFAQSLFAANIFASNFLFWKESGYFAGAAELKPLLHTWSLAIEEQFYLIFPICMIGLYRLGNHWRITIIVIAALASLVLAEWASQTYPTASFYFLPTRAWELLAGALVALTAKRFPRSGVLSEIGSLAGLCMIAYAVMTFDESVVFPGLWGLIPVLGTVLVVFFAHSDTRAGRLLSWPPLVTIGLMSYSAYLWHQPLFAFARIRLLDGVSDSMYMILIAATFGFAWLTWRYIEQPCRDRARIPAKRILLMAVAFAGTFLALGAGGHIYNGLPLRLGDNSLQILQRYDVAFPRRADCHGTGQAIRPKDACVYNNTGWPEMALWGDSQAFNIAEVLGEELRSENKALRVMTLAGCIPVPGIHWHHRHDACVRHNENVQTFLKNRAVDPVIMMGRFTLNMEKNRFANAQGGVEHGRPVFAVPEGRGRAFIHNQKRKSEIGLAFRKSVQALLKHGKHVVLVYPLPEMGWHVPEHRARQLHYGVDKPQVISIDAEIYRQRTQATRRALDRLGKHDRLLRIRPAEIFCDTYRPRRCVAEHDGELFYKDGTHLSRKGQNIFVKHMLSKMVEKGWL